MTSFINRKVFCIHKRNLCESLSLSEYIISMLCNFLFRVKGINAFNLNRNNVIKFEMIHESQLNRTTALHYENKTLVEVVLNPLLQQIRIHLDSFLFL